MTQQRYNIELPKVAAELFKAYLREKELVFEASEAGNLVHIELKLNRKEYFACSEWLKTTFGWDETPELTEKEILKLSKRLKNDI